MKPIYVGSVMERSGKSTIAMGLAKSINGMGYFKPFRESSVNFNGKLVDRDALLMASVLNLSSSPEELSPLVYDPFAPPQPKDVLEAYKKVEQECMLIEGTRDIITGWSGNLSGMAIARDLDAEIILVSPATISAVDKICMLHSFMKQVPGLFKGVILNQTDDERYGKLLETQGIDVLGTVPALDELKKFRVSEISSLLSAEVLVPGRDVEIEHVVIGAVNSDLSATQMRRLPAKALITRGDRGDIQNAALSTDLACLILTGGFHPSNAILSLAYERGVTVLLTHLDNIDAAEIIGQHLAYISPEDENKISKAVNVVKDNIDLDKIINC